MFPSCAWTPSPRLVALFWDYLGDDSIPPLPASVHLVLSCPQRSASESDLFQLQPPEWSPMLAGQELAASHFPCRMSQMRMLARAIPGATMSFKCQFIPLLPAGEVVLLRGSLTHPLGCLQNALFQPVTKIPTCIAFLTRNSWITLRLLPGHAAAHTEQHLEVMGHLGGGN